MEDLKLQLIQLAQKIGREKIKKEDTEFQNIVEKYDNVLQEFDAYLSRYLDDREKLDTLNTHLMAISFGINEIIDKYKDYLNKTELKVNLNSLYGKKEGE